MASLTNDCACLLLNGAGTNGNFPSWNVQPVQQLQNLPLRITTNMAVGRDASADACNGTPIGDFSDSIALIRRGTCTFAEKIQNVIAAGARAVIIWNRDPGQVWPITVGDNVAVPYLTISGADGDSLASAVNNTQRVNLNLFTVVAFRYIRYIGGGGVSSYSSWGPAPNLQLTPDIAAPGGNVYSLAFWSDMTQRAPTTILSGTSFSAPYIAGCAALYLQAARAVGLRPTPTQLRDAFAATARPIQRINTSSGDLQQSWESPLRVGAGRINLAAAIRALIAPSTFTPSTLLLPTGRQQATSHFSITNGSPNVSAHYSLHHIPTDSISTDNAMNISYDITVSPAQYKGVPYIPNVDTSGLRLTFVASSGVSILDTGLEATVTIEPNSTVTVQASRVFEKGDAAAAVNRLSESVLTRNQSLCLHMRFADSKY